MNGRKKYLNGTPKIKAFESKIIIINLHKIKFNFTSYSNVRAEVRDEDI